MRETRSAPTELPRRPRDPSDLAPGELYVPEVPGPEDDLERSLEKRVDEIAESLWEIRELLEQVLRELRKLRTGRGVGGEG